MRMLWHIRDYIYGLLRKRKRDRSLLFTRDNIRIDPGIHYDEDEIVAYVEAWFDAEAKFGIKLADKEFINMYAKLTPYTDDLRIEYVLYRYDGRRDELHRFTALTKDEKALVREMIEEANLKETGKTVDGTWFSFMNEDCFNETVPGEAAP